MPAMSGQACSAHAVKAGMAGKMDATQGRHSRGDGLIPWFTSGYIARVSDIIL